MVTAIFKIDQAGLSTVVSFLTIIDVLNLSSCLHNFADTHRNSSQGTTLLSDGVR